MAEAKKSEDKKEEKKGEDRAKLSGGLPNKPGEPDFKLTLEPDGCVVFKGDKLLSEPGRFEWKLTNNTGKRQAFKIKCTSNEIFRVRPPLGFIEDKQSVVIRLTSVIKEIISAHHYFAIYHMAFEDKSVPIRTVFTPSSKLDGVKRLLCVFQRNDGSEYKVGEKGPGGVTQSMMQPAPGAPKAGEDKKEAKAEVKGKEEKKEEPKEVKKEEPKEEKKEEKKEEADDKKKEEKKEEPKKEEKKKEEKKDEKKDDKKDDKKDKKPAAKA